MKKKYKKYKFKYLNNSYGSKTTINSQSASISFYSLTIKDIQDIFTPSTFKHLNYLIFKILSYLDIIINHKTKFSKCEKLMSLIKFILSHMSCDVIS